MLAGQLRLRLVELVLAKKRAFPARRRGRVGDGTHRGIG